MELLHCPLPQQPERGGGVAGKRGGRAGGEQEGEGKGEGGGFSGSTPLCYSHLLPPPPLMPSPDNSWQRVRESGEGEGEGEGRQGGGDVAC